jgi:hypothetical protein
MDTKLIEAANARGHHILGEAEIQMDRGGAMRGGLLCAANEAAFAEAFFSEAITTFVTGLPAEAGVQEMLDFVAPQVPCGRRFEYRNFGNTQQMLSETDDIRGTGSNFKTVEYKGSLETGRTVNKGLAFIGDLDVLSEIPNWEQLYAGWLRGRILRNDLRRAITALLALHAGTTAKWVTTPVTDPDTDLLDLVESLGDNVGLDANALLFGSQAWSYRVKNLRSTDKAGGFASSMWSPAEVASWLGLSEGCRKSTHRYATGSGDKTRMVGAYAVAFHRSGSPVMEDPSSVKRFVTTTKGLYQVYRRELGPKLIEISVGHYSNIVGVGAARRLNVQ